LVRALRQDHGFTNGPQTDIEQIQQLLADTVTQIAAAQRAQQEEQELIRAEQQQDNASIRDQLTALAASVAGQREPSPSPFIAPGTAPPASVTVPPIARRRPRTNSSESSAEEEDKAEHGLYGWQKDANAIQYGGDFDTFMASLSAPEMLHVEKDYDYLLREIINHRDPRRIALLHRVNVSDAATQRLRSDYKARYFHSAKGAALETAQLKFWELRNRETADKTLKSVQQAIMGLLQARYRNLYIESKQLSKCENAGTPPHRNRDSIVAEHLWLFQLRQLIPDRVDKAQSASMLDQKQINEKAYMDRMLQRDPSSHAILLEQQRTRVMAQEVDKLAKLTKARDQSNRGGGKDKDKWKPKGGKDKDKWKPKDGSPIVKVAVLRAGKKPGSHSS
jgi:hypothetical protein